LNMNNRLNIVEWKYKEDMTKKMTGMNLALKLSVFDISLSIEKNDERVKTSMDKRSGKNEIVKRNDLRNDYYFQSLLRP